MKKTRAKPAMQPHTDAHPGIEMEGKGRPIPVAERLAEDRRKAHRASAKKAGKPSA
ncbi:MAG: hypothetical protein WDN01_20235 [Rhizomicrobium sp.]